MCIQIPVLGKNFSLKSTVEVNVCNYLVVSFVHYFSVSSSMYLLFIVCIVLYTWQMCIERSLKTYLAYWRCHTRTGGS